MLTDGGITSRIGSFGWSWWTPCMIQWSRAPRPSSGSKWKITRWSQYSVSVQNSVAPREPRQGLERTHPLERARREHGDGREEDQDGDGGMNPGEPVQELRLEHPR